MIVGTLFIISAPSGAGKTSLVKALSGDVQRLRVSVSHTTRQQRPGEVDGDDYFFVPQEKFEQMIAKGAFLEYAEVFGNCYGTADKTVTDALSTGDDVILEIDWQGAQLVRKKIPSVASIFILPPSLQELETRLKVRGQDSEETIKWRMQKALAEISHYHEFEFLIVNDDFDQALQELKSIFLASRLKCDRQKLRLQSMLKSYNPY